MDEHDFDPDEARSLLSKKGAMEVPCVACGEGRWEISPVLTGLLAVQAGNEGFPSLSDPARVVSLVCWNCGFVRFHDLALLQE